MLMYRFARCQTHPKCPDLQGWYLILEPNDIDTLMNLHKGVSCLYFHKFGVDPHITESEIAGLYNPILLTAKWLLTVEKYHLAGTTIFVNSSGGILPPECAKVLGTVESQTMSWPNIYEDEVITICRWPEGRHYYLSSNKDRVFVPSKYIEYKAALHAAKKYTDDVKTEGC